MKFIHPKAVLEGEGIEIGDGSSVWACATIRSDEGAVKIGRNTSVQEHVAIHGTGTVIGDNVTIGHSAVVHGCRIGSNVIVGINSSVLSGAEIGDWCIIGAGAVVTEGKKIPSGSMVLGIPGKVVRELAQEDRERVTASWKAYQGKLAKIGK